MQLKTLSYNLQKDIYLRDFILESEEITSTKLDNSGLAIRKFIKDTIIPEGIVNISEEPTTVIPILDALFTKIVGQPTETFLYLYPEIFSIDAFNKIKFNNTDRTNNLVALRVHNILKHLDDGMFYPLLEKNSYIVRGKKSWSIHTLDKTIKMKYLPVLEEIMSYSKLEYQKYQVDLDKEKTIVIMNKLGKGVESWYQSLERL